MSRLCPLSNKPSSIINHHQPNQLCITATNEWLKTQGALAHPSPLIVTQTAQLCLQLYSVGGRGCDHRQSRRFLSPDYDEGEHDPGLRAAVEALANGSNIDGLDERLKASYAKWMGAFRLVRTVERSVEGVHSIITKLMKRAPAAKVPYISLDLRFHMLKPILSEMAFCPQATQPYLRFRRGKRFGRH